MIKKLLKLFSGTVLASFSIACVVQSGFGCFSTTCANFSIANWLGVSVGMAGFLIEIIVLAMVVYLGEGVSITGLINMSLGSILIDVFIWLLPQNKLMIFGLLLAGIGWALQGQSGLGETHNNLLMTAILKRTKMKIWKVKAIQEFIYVVVGLLNARNYVTWFTIILSLGIGYLIQVEYKLMKYEPTEVKQSFLIKGKQYKIVK